MQEGSKCSSSIVFTNFLEGGCWIHKLVTQSAGCRTSHKSTSVHNFYGVKYNKNFTQQCYRLYLHKINLSTEYKECVFKYFLKAVLNFTLPFLRTVTLGGKLLKILKAAQNVLFLKTRWVGI